MKDCLDIGTIQAFLDGEIAHDQTARISGHIAGCDACAFMLAEAEDESAIVFPALEREFNTLVPTQRLWNKINVAIVTERQGRPFWHKAWAFLSVALANPSLAAAASLVIVVGVFAAVWMNRTSVLVEGTQVQTTAKTSPSQIDTAPVIANPVIVQAVTTSKPDMKVERTAYRSDNRRINTPVAIKATATSGGYLPGEESYVKTISSLNNAVKDQKDALLRPSERIAYERDMAVVNDTIAKMKTEVKRNPRNGSARQILYSSYQNKIDLLNSVVHKEELVASLR
ncbi:MAG: zf-HC2 domain-containing protein [Pyrinomonadaceae bacterium]